MGSILHRRFDNLARTEHGTLHFIEDNADAVVPINHGYDETKPESELDIADMRQAAQHRNEQGRLERQAGISVRFRT